MSARNLILVLLLFFAACCFWKGFSSSTTSVAPPPDSDQAGFIVTDPTPRHPGSGAASSVFLADIISTENGPFGLLGQELMRQAFLNAARDELGADTRDAALGEEPLREGSRNYVLCINATQRLVMSLCTVGTSAGQLLGAGMDYPVQVRDTETRVEDYLALVSALDRFGRGRITETLKADGVALRAPSAEPISALPIAITADLASMSIMRQCSALRALHVLARVHGPSALLTGALARGYANASLLTHQLWSDTSLVFAARALLYAERTVAATSSSPWALRQRAYARILVGFIDQGCADLDAADATESMAEIEPTPWVSILRHFAAFDYVALELDAKKHCTHLALLLSLLTVVHALDQDLVRPLGDRTLALEKTCFRAIDALGEGGDEKDLARSVDLAPRAMELALNEELGRAPDLPRTAAIHIVESGGLDRCPGVITALREASVIPCGEPSWAAIGQIIADQLFRDAFRGAKARHDVKSSGMDAIGPSALPITGHRYQNLVLAFAFDPGSQAARISSLFQDVQFAHFRPDMHDGLELLNRVDPKRACAVWEACLGRSDPVLWDLAWETCLPEPSKSEHAKRLAAVASHSPLMALMRLTDERAAWDRMTADADRREFGIHPSILWTLANHAMAFNQWREAQDELEMIVALTPTRYALRTLAKCRLHLRADAM
jgi:hypothetical protein